MLLELLFNNQIIIIALYILLHLFLFYSLGAVLQEYFSFKTSNRYISISLGYIFWLLVTLVAFLLPILFELNKNWFKVANFIKDLSFIFMIILYYKSWFPNVEKVNLRFVSRISISFFIIFFSVILFIILNKYTPTSNIDEKFVTSFLNIEKSNGKLIFEINDSGNPSLMIIEKYETFYYWLYLTSSNLTSVSLINLKDIIIPSLLITASTSIILGIVVDPEKSIISHLIAFILSMLFVLLEWGTGILNQMFYTIPLLLISFMMIYDYSSKEVPSENSLITSLISLVALITVTDLSIFFLLMIGLVIVSISIIKKGEIVDIMYRYSVAVATLVISYALVAFIVSITKAGAFEFGSQFTILVMLIILFAAIITPIRSLSKTNSRREDLVSFESKISKRRITNLIIFSSIVTLASICIYFLLGGKDIFKVIDGYFDIIIYDQIWLSLTIYIVTILIPTLIIMFIAKRYEHSSLLNTIPYLTLILNPITSSLLLNSLDWICDWEIIFIPQVIIFILWCLSKLIDLIPEKIKI